MPTKTPTSSRTMKARAMAKAGYSYVAGWLPAAKAAAVKKQIAAASKSAAKASQAKPKATPSTAHRKALTVTPTSMATGTSRAERIARAG